MNHDPSISRTPSPSAAPHPAPPAPAVPADDHTLTTDPVGSTEAVWGSTGRDRLRYALWQTFGRPLMRCTFHNWYAVRRVLLNLFGGAVHPTARVRPTARISHPWNLRVGAHTAIGDEVIIFSLGEVRIGDRCTISQYTHLCAAGHAYTQRQMPLIAHPIEIKDDVWLAADTFVGPGVVIGEGTVVGARSTVIRNLPEWSICSGDNARKRGERTLHEPRAVRIDTT